MGDPIVVNFSPTILNGSVAFSKLSPQLQEDLEQMQESGGQHIFIAQEAPEYVSNSIWIDQVEHKIYYAGEGWNELVLEGGGGGSGIEIVDDYPNDDLTDENRGLMKFLRSTSGSPINWTFTVNSLDENTDLYMFLNGTQLYELDNPIGIGSFNPSDYATPELLMLAIASGVQTNVIQNQGLDSKGWSITTGENSFSIVTIDSRAFTAIGVESNIRKPDDTDVYTSMPIGEPSNAFMDKFLVIVKDKYNDHSLAEVITDRNIYDLFRGNALKNDIKRVKITSEHIDNFVANGFGSVAFTNIGYEYNSDTVLSRVFTIYKNGQPLIGDGDDYDIESFNDTPGSLEIVIRLWFNEFHTEFVVDDIYTLVRTSYQID